MRHLSLVISGQQRAFVQGGEELGNEPGGRFGPSSNLTNARRESYVQQFQQDGSGFLSFEALFTEFGRWGVRRPGPRNEEIRIDMVQRHISRQVDVVDVDALEALLSFPGQEWGNDDWTGSCRPEKRLFESLFWVEVLPGVKRPLGLFSRGCWGRVWKRWRRSVEMQSRGFGIVELKSPGSNWTLGFWYEMAPTARSLKYDFAVSIVGNALDDRVVGVGLGADV